MWAGPAFWTAFVLGVGIATITGLAYAELVTRYPQAAGAALYIAKAFKNDFFTFVITFCMLSASLCAAGALALTFGGDYFQEFLAWPTVAVASGFIVVLALLNYRGISESVRANLVMTLIEASGLIIIITIGILTLVRGEADLGSLTTFDKESSPALAILGGALRPARRDDRDGRRLRRLRRVGGRAAGGRPAGPARPADLAVRADRADRGGQYLPGRPDHPVADPVRHGARGCRTRRLRAGPPLDADALVIVACLKLRSEPEDPAPDGSFRANTVLLYVGIVGNIGLLGYTLATDPSSLVYCAALLTLGLVLYAAEKVWSRRRGASS